jgi:hypothetical protein
MSIITESKTTRLVVLLVMIMGVAMIMPNNLALASADDGSDNGGGSDDGSSDEGTTEESEEQLTEEPIEELPPIDEEPIDSCKGNSTASSCGTDPVDPCLEGPNAVGCGTDPVDPCLTNPTAPECQDPCVENPDLDGCEPSYCIPEDPYCMQKCPPGFHFHRGLCIEDPDDDDNNGGSRSETTIILPSATTVEVSNCKIDGNTHGIQQRFNPVRYQACGLYPNGQVAYTDGFVMGCTQVGNTQQLCQAFVVMNTQQPQIQPTTQSTTQPSQAILPADGS